MKKDYVIISGSRNKALAFDIAKGLNKQLSQVEFRIFPNKEQNVHIKESIEGKRAYIIQSLSENPDSALMEFLLLADAAKNAGATEIIGIIPWLAYSPQDKIFRPGEPLSSRLVAKTIKAAGFKKVFLLDLHSSLNEKYFLDLGIKVNHLSALEIFADFFESQAKASLKKDWIVLCIDQGARKRSRKLAQKLNLEMVCLKKNRDLSTGKVDFKDFSANIKGRKIVAFDDFVSTAGSLVKASQMLKKLGVKKIVNFITHGLLCPGSISKIKQSQIDKLYLTDSYPIGPKKRISKIKVLSCAPLFIKSVRENEKSSTKQE
ncbi:MAG: ribose-phosphate diphosphokinase [Candidatus Moranbacteria bacterium]|nr:ribose-phosphate diphosphokinase [Candidatus Moranbacteria bacterium]